MIGVGAYSPPLAAVWKRRVGQETVDLEVNVLAVRVDGVVVDFLVVEVGSMAGHSARWAKGEDVFFGSLY